MPYLYSRLLKKIVTLSLLVSTSSTLLSTGFSTFRRLISVGLESFELEFEWEFVIFFAFAFGFVDSLPVLSCSVRVAFLFTFLALVMSLGLHIKEAKRSSHDSSQSLNWANVPLHLRKNWNFCERRYVEKSFLQYLSNRIHADAMTLMLSISFVARAFRKTLKLKVLNNVSGGTPNYILSGSIWSFLHFQMSEFNPQSGFLWIISAIHNCGP